MFNDKHNKRPLHNRQNKARQDAQNQSTGGVSGEGYSPRFGSTEGSSRFSPRRNQVQSYRQIERALLSSEDGWRVPKIEDREQTGGFPPSKSVKKPTSEEEQLARDFPIGMLPSTRRGESRAAGREYNETWKGHEAFELAASEGTVELVRCSTSPYSSPGPSSPRVPPVPVEYISGYEAGLAAGYAMGHATGTASASLGSRPQLQQSSRYMRPITKKRREARHTDSSAGQGRGRLGWAFGESSSRYSSLAGGVRVIHNSRSNGPASGGVTLKMSDEFKSLPTTFDHGLNHNVGADALAWHESVTRSVTPAASAALGQTSLGQTSLGQTSLGQTSLGQTSLGQSSLGQTSLGQSSLGGALGRPKGSPRLTPLASKGSPRSPASLLPSPRERAVNSPRDVSSPRDPPRENAISASPWEHARGYAREQQADGGEKLAGGGERLAGGGEMLIIGEHEASGDGTQDGMQGGMQGGMQASRASRLGTAEFQLDSAAGASAEHRPLTGVTFSADQRPLTGAIGEHRPLTTSTRPNTTTRRPNAAITISATIAAEAQQDPSLMSAGDAEAYAMAAAVTPTDELPAWMKSIRYGGRPGGWLGPAAPMVYGQSRELTPVAGAHRPSTGMPPLPPSPGTRPATSYNAQASPREQGAPTFFSWSSRAQTPAPPLSPRPLSQKLVARPGSIAASAGRTDAAAVIIAGAPGSPAPIA